ncbi:MAG: RidA family protein [Thermomicrobiales bacterium]|nr:RidA family protein [Thermomicrobiales bacterium]
MGPEAKLKELGYELTLVEYGDAALVPWVRIDNMLYMSGRTPDRSGKQWRGQVGKEYTTAEAREAAREVAWSQLCAAKTALGDLSKIKRVVKVLGMVNGVPGYAEQPQVINGFSDLLVEVFGEAGRHARSAVGMSGLPGNVPVEVEVIFEIDEP